VKKRADHEPGYVLHTYAYKETSLIVEAFTRRHGRVALLARGARRPRSAMRGILLAFHPLRLGWSGSAELANLMQAEWGGTLQPGKAWAALRSGGASLNAAIPLTAVRGVKVGTRVHLFNDVDGTTDDANDALAVTADTDAPGSLVGEGGLGPPDAAEAGPTSCDPMLPATFMPTWTPPTVVASACSTADLAAYYHACLENPGVTETLTVVE